ncbi:DUF1493 family protein [Erwinia amylovora]
MKYGDSTCPARKEWTFHKHFNFVQDNLEEMLFDLFTRYEIEHSKFNIDNYFMPELYSASRKSAAVISWLIV